MYQPCESRYEKMKYKRCGRSGILLPRISLGMWQNFGLEKTLEEQKRIFGGRKGGGESGENFEGGFGAVPGPASDFHQGGL